MTDKPIWTGVYDRNNNPINVGDILKSPGAMEDKGMEVKDVVSFLMFCGAYEQEHKAPFCDSIVVTTPVFYGDSDD